VGFYFGAPTDSETKTGSLALSVPVLPNPAPDVGDTLKLPALASGGKPPYVYSVALMAGNGSIGEIKDQRSKNGRINAAFVMEKKSGGGDYQVKPQLTVEDSQGVSAILMGAGVQVKEKPPEK